MFNIERNNLTWNPTGPDGNMEMFAYFVHC